MDLTTLKIELFTAGVTFHDKMALTITVKDAASTNGMFFSDNPSECGLKPGSAITPSTA